jgi:hypothetical protein
MMTSADALPATAATPATTMAAWAINRRIFMVGLLSGSPDIGDIHSMREATL